MELLFGRNLVNASYFWAFLVASLGWGILVSVAAVLVGAWRFRQGLADRTWRGLPSFRRRRDVVTLLAHAVLENFDRAGLRVAHG
jgi:hypothetical protein